MPSHAPLPLEGEPTPCHSCSTDEKSITILDLEETSGSFGRFSLVSQCFKEIPVRSSYLFSCLVHEHAKQLQELLVNLCKQSLGMDLKAGITMPNMLFVFSDPIY